MMGSGLVGVDWHTSHPERSRTQLVPGLNAIVDILDNDNNDKMIYLGD